VSIQANKLNQELVAHDNVEQDKHRREQQKIYNEKILTFFGRWTPDRQFDIMVVVIDLLLLVEYTHFVKMASSGEAFPSLVWCVVVSVVNAEIFPIVRIVLFQPRVSVTKRKILLVGFLFLAFCCLVDARFILWHLLLLVVSVPWFMLRN
jgi:hypothetical protein